jgi:hypothetical protein
VLPVPTGQAPVPKKAGEPAGAGFATRANTTFKLPVTITHGCVASFTLTLSWHRSVPCHARAGSYLDAMPLEPAQDHLRAAEDRQRAIVRGLSPQQRLQQALRMNRSMRQLLAAGFRARNPAWTEAEVHRAVADRILHGRTG